MLGRIVLLVATTFVFAACASAPAQQRWPSIDVGSLPPVPPAARPDDGELVGAVCIAASPKSMLLPSRDPRLPRWSPMRNEAAIDAEITRLQSELDGSADRVDTLFAIADALSERANVFDALPRPYSCGRNQARIDAVNTYVRLSEELKRTRDVRLFSAAYYGSLEMELDGRSDWAASEYRLVMHFGPPSLQPFAAFGLAELEWRDLDEPEAALTDFKRVLEFQRNALTPYALLRLAEVSQRRGDMEAAAMWRGRLSSEFPDSAAAKN